jgi:hypothetical protein
MDARRRVNSAITNQQFLKYTALTHAARKAGREEV